MQNIFQDLPSCVIQLFRHGYFDGIFISFVFAFCHHTYVIELCYQKLTEINFQEKKMILEDNQKIGDKH